MTILTKEFWMATLDRAIKTAAQSVGVAWAVGDQMLNALEIDWELTFGLASGGFLAAVITSLATGTATGGTRISVAKSEQVVHRIRE